MRQFSKTSNHTYSRNRVTQIYLREVSQSKLLTPEEEYKLALQAQKGDQEAVQELVKANLRFVISVSKMYALKEDDQQEMIAAGNVGLIEAAQKFDPTRGFKFISYAVWHIRKEMISHIRKTRHTVAVPPSHLDLMRKAKEGRDILFSKLGHEPPEMDVFEYVAAHTKSQPNMGFENFLEIYQNQVSCSSLDAPLKVDEDSTLTDVLDSGVATSGMITESSDALDKMHRLLNVLSEREREIVRLHHGIDHLCPVSFPDIASGMGVSTARVEKIYRDSLKKLLRSARSHGITKDLMTET